MMNQDDSFFSALLSQECAPFDPSENVYASRALLGVDSIDSMDYFADTNFSNFDLFDSYQIPVYSHESPGALSPPSLPPSPISSTGDLSDLGVADAPAPYSHLSPTGSSVTSLFDTSEEVKPTKTDLEGFEYNPFTRKWVCTKCEGDFVSTHEARRHVKTAAKCTGKKVKCLRCGDHIHASGWSRKRHFAAKKCQKGGRKRGAPTYTVNNAFEDL
ncbi:hypothetical protein BJ322DRAFT_1049200 [Thelephora terrestris]|uniref:Uncharacterized protein n=1 Tax=Thelephora terrestris TaxID=56493 RepID=A0A9P6L9W4_9AGAM|nr:hypothetical protein BJ322DRAFT_1049200 [Thelephora terrestris]